MKLGKSNSEGGTNVWQFNNDAFVCMHVHEVLMADEYHKSVSFKQKDTSSQHVFPCAQMYLDFSIKMSAIKNNIQSNASKFSNNKTTV